MTKIMETLRSIFFKNILPQRHGAHREVVFLPDRETTVRQISQRCGQPAKRVSLLATYRQLFFLCRRLPAKEKKIRLRALCASSVAGGKIKKPKYAFAYTPIMSK
jgi:hypothetical protein